MMKYLFLLLPLFAQAGSLPPSAYPVFLKAGFSSVLEFDEAPSRVVLGDSQSFQIEKLDHSLVVKTLTPYAATNMFVYFGSETPRLFVLTASEDAEPTYYRKFEAPNPPKSDSRLEEARSTAPRTYKQGAKVLLAQFDAKKDYLTIEVELAADGKEPIRPAWPLVRLKSNSAVIVPYRLWAERQEVQKDASIRTRFIFAKPNIPRDLKGVFLIIPIQGTIAPMTLALKASGK
jgi:hypothetical protein